MKELERVAIRLFKKKHKDWSWVDMKPLTRTRYRNLAWEKINEQKEVEE